MAGTFVLSGKDKARAAFGWQRSGGPAHVSFASLANDPENEAPYVSTETFGAWKHQVGAWASIGWPQSCNCQAPTLDQANGFLYA